MANKSRTFTRRIQRNEMLIDIPSVAAGGSSVPVTIGIKNVKPGDLIFAVPTGYTDFASGLIVTATCILAGQITYVARNTSAAPIDAANQLFTIWVIQ